MMSECFYIDTGNVGGDGSDKKSKKNKNKHKKGKVLALEEEVEDEQFRYVSQALILGEDVVEEKEAAEDDRPKGRRPAFRRSANKRYHETGGESARAGVLSESLRQALGLHRGELPFFIYRMRSLGYPPGWLKEHELERSGLSIVGEDEGFEDQVQYDLDKLLEFPGFNVPAPKGFVDDWKRKGALPMQKEHSLEAMRRQLARKAEAGAAASLADQLRPDGGHDGSANGCSGGKKKKKKRKRQEVIEEPVEPKSARMEPSEGSGENSLASEAELSLLEEQRRRIIDQLNSTQAEEEEEEEEDPRNGAGSPSSENDKASSESAEGSSKSADETSVAIAATLGSPVCLSVNASRQLPDVAKFSAGIEEFRPNEENDGMAGTYQKVMTALRDAKRGRKS